ncbi:hypothetical protein [Peribacillus frigoritolerans]|nr:hypothetical protein [Peribacillus frigoritolerans]MCY8938971.1 hypothetical protein [Peribacillus frigoritolerans]
MPNEIIIGNVIRDLEGPLAPMSCVALQRMNIVPLKIITVY